MRVFSVAGQMLFIDMRAALEEVRGEGVTEGVASDALGNAGLQRRRTHGTLHDGLVQVVAALDATPLFLVARRGGEDPLPYPILRRIGDLARDGVGEDD